MAIDVSDATFATEVVERSAQVPVVVDLWAEWCGPCRTLGPILEKVIDETQGKVILAKVDVDSNPQVAQAFQVQGIPAVYALRDGKVVNGFVGAQPESAVRLFVQSLLPGDEEQLVDRLLGAGDETSLRQALELEPGNEAVVVALAELLVRRGGDGDVEEALGLLERIPETPESRRVAALARAGGPAALDGALAELDQLLDQVKGDDGARQRYVDLLELMGPDDPRTAQYRKELSKRLF
jgi:putative thioredoxin